MSYSIECSCARVGTKGYKMYPVQLDDTVFWKWYNGMSLIFGSREMCMLLRVLSLSITSSMYPLQMSIPFEAYIFCARRLQESRDVMQLD